MYISVGLTTNQRWLYTCKLVSHCDGGNSLSDTNVSNQITSMWSGCFSCEFYCKTESVLVFMFDNVQRIGSVISINGKLWKEETQNDLCSYKDILLCFVTCDSILTFALYYNVTSRNPFTNGLVIYCIIKYEYIVYKL